MNIEWSLKEKIVLHYVHTSYIKLFYMIMFLIALNVAQCAQSASAKTSEIVNAVQDASSKYGVSYDLVMAIIEVESGFNINAVGGKGEIGLMQILPSIHGPVSFDVVDNIDTGVRYLSDIRSICSSRAPNSWWVFYNYGPYRQLESPRNTNYYKKVMSALSEKSWGVADSGGNR